jgi:hypothetical protein
MNHALCLFRIWVIDTVCYRQTSLLTSSKKIRLFSINMFRNKFLGFATLAD